VVQSLDEAAAWVDATGLALVFPKSDLVLPSLWEQVNGSPEQNWAIRDPDGGFVRWTEPMAFLWGAKDDLPAAGLACVGKHLARVAACVAPRLVPVLVASRADPPLEGLEAEVVAVISDGGPMTSPELRAVTGAAKKDVDKAIASLHRQLVLTTSHLVEEGGPWGAIAHDLLARKWRLPDELPPLDEARAQLAALVLAHAGELTAADLAAPFGWRRKEAAEVLDRIAAGRDEDGFRIWARP
jgi:chromosome segregation and condensation protein ScpB